MQHLLDYMLQLIQTLRASVLSLISMTAGQIPVRHYKHKGQWYAKPVSGGTAQELNMKGISQHRQKYRVSKRIDGKLFRWNFNTLKEAVAKRDAIFA